MDKIFTLNQNIEVVNVAVSQHLNDIGGNFIYDVTSNTEVMKHYRLSYYI